MRKVMIKSNYQKLAEQKKCKGYSSPASGD